METGHPSTQVVETGLNPGLVASYDMQPGNGLRLLFAIISAMTEDVSAPAVLVCLALLQSSPRPL